jgi:predicted ribosomally synthesized peptide with SipW-like signal peptide
MNFPVHIKLLVSLAIVGLAASIASLATFASFTSSTSAQAQSLSAGTVSLALGTANRLTIGASNLVPGDTIERAIDLTNDGSAGTSSVGSITVTTTGSGTALDSDTSNGLQMTIDSCSVAWTESGPPYTYSCGGTTSSVLASRPVIGTNVALSNMSAVTAGSTDHLRVTLTLPSSADNSFQGLGDTLNYVFTANQRTAGNQ